MVVWAAVANADLAISKLASQEIYDEWNLWRRPHWNWHVWLTGMLILAFLTVWEGFDRVSADLQKAIADTNQEAEKREALSPEAP